MIWRCRRFTFDLARTHIMGVVNVTPDSFSDGGRFLDAAVAIDHARRLREEGADLLDVGGESTRPGAPAVTAHEQWRRIGPVVEALAADGVCVSVDTASAAVARRALDAGASVVNDVTALGDSGMVSVVADAEAGLVLMHMQGTPATMQQAPHYDDVVAEVRGFLAGRAAGAEAAGIAPEAIAVDPGIGFGKSPEHNHTLIAELDGLATLGRPVVIGVSRKRFLGRPLDLAVGERLEAGLAATSIAVLLGAHVVRTHDVAATRRALVIADALRDARRPLTGR